MSAAIEVSRAIYVLEQDARDDRHGPLPRTLVRYVGPCEVKAIARADWRRPNPRVEWRLDGKRTTKRRLLAAIEA